MHLYELEILTSTTHWLPKPRQLRRPRRSVNPSLFTQAYRQYAAYRRCSLGCSKQAEWNGLDVLNASKYALLCESFSWPPRCVAAVICNAVGATLSARNIMASKKERSVTKRADKVVWAIWPSWGSNKKPAVAVIRTIRHSCALGTPASSATSPAEMLLQSGISAKIWNEPSHRRLARSWFCIRI